MSRKILIDAQTGALLDGPAEGLEAGEGQYLADWLASAELGETMWSPGRQGFVDAPRLTRLQVLALYTAQQHARARRMLFATYPPGHMWEGQLIDPDGLTQRLVDATIAMEGPILVTSQLHQNGTAFLRAVGVIETDVEAARISAGIPPEGGV